MPTTAPTFFEITTAMGLLYFARRRAQAVVLEVGMGGRLDSTNVVHPALSIITSISFDHTRQLGNTLGLIAREKAGILKRRPAGGQRCARAGGAARHRPCGRPAALPTARARHRFLIRRRFRRPARSSRPTTGSVAARRGGPTGERSACPCSARTRRTTPRSRWPGSTSWPRSSRGLAVSRDDVVRGFAGLKWPARVELLGERPWLVIDGAHNAASAQALAETLRTCFPPGRRTLIFGTTREKDLQGQLRAVLPSFDTVIATRYVENPRAVEPETIAAAVVRLTGLPARVTTDPAEALELARQLTVTRRPDLRHRLALPGRRSPSGHLAPRALAALSPAFPPEPDRSSRRAAVTAPHPIRGQPIERSTNEREFLAASRGDLGFPGRGGRRLWRARAQRAV